MSLENDANANEGGKLDPETEADLIDLTSGTENVSEDETGSLSPLVDLHACGICFQPYNDSERLPKVLSCGHTNCLACLNSWVKHGSSVFPVCAVCRKITHKPVYLLPNNFQLLEVLRRMKLISMDSPPTFPEQPQNACSAVGSNASEMDAVCEKIDGYMNDIASLLESQMERLRMNEQHPRATGHNTALRTVEHSVAAFLQQWQSTRRCLRFTNNPKFYPRESGSYTDLMDLVDLMYADGVFEDDFDFSSHDSLSRSPPGEERPYEYLGSSVSDILPEDFDFSLFEGDNQEAVISVSLSSSPGENFLGSDEQDSSIFPHITILDTYSYCTLCHCRIPRNLANYRTHILGRRHQLNGATERSREGNIPARGRPYNRHRNRHQTRRTHIGASASGQNTGSTNTPLRISTSVAVENDTGRIIPSGSPSWLEFAPQRGNNITDDRASWRDSAETIVANASDRPSGRRNWSDFTTEWRYGWNPDNSSPRTHTNMQRRNRGAVQLNRGNIETTASRRGSQRPQSSNHGGNLPAGGVSHVPNGNYTFRQPHHRFSTGDSRRLNPGDNRWLDELLTHRRNEVSWLLR